MAKATKLRQRIIFAFEPEKYDRIYFMERVIQKVICIFCGHVPERDQCGIAAHDYCFWCKKSMPHSWSTKQT